VAKRALIIANSRYDDHHFATLPAATADAAALGDPGIGGFEVDTLVDVEQRSALRALEFDADRLTEMRAAVLDAQPWKRIGSLSLVEQLLGSVRESTRDAARTALLGLIADENREVARQAMRGTHRIPEPFSASTKRMFSSPGIPKTYSTHQQVRDVLHCCRIPDLRAVGAHRSNVSTPTRPGHSSAASRDGLCGDGPRPSSRTASTAWAIRRRCGGALRGLPAR
jgi:hypothetical protein